MRGKFLCSVVLALATHAVSAAESNQTELKDPYFGEALYYAYQGDYFDAIARLDTELKQYYGVDEPQLDTLSFHINEAEFDVGDFELYYRMHRRAGRAIKAVIEGNVAPEVRNEAIYRLARIYFQKEQNINALHTIERIEGKVAEKLVSDVAFLKAQIYMANGKFTDAAKIFSSLEGEERFTGFASYNLGVALYAQGKDKEEEAFQKLAQAGQVEGDRPGVAEIRDKANLALATKLMEMGKVVEARKYFSRVRLEGPFSNRALLGLGWTRVKQEDYRRALVPWSILLKRNDTDSSVQEAMIGAPYAYGKLGLYGRAALLYGSALETISGELDKLDASIKSIKEGKFLKALVREEIKKNKDWVIRLRNLPETPETYYLMDLMASHDFQSMLQNYLDLEQLRKKLDSWESYYGSYEDLIAHRRAYYEPLLPEIDEKFRKLDSRISLRIEQRDRIENRLHNMLIAPRPDFLATADERIVRARINKLEKRLKNKSPATQHRIDRLKGYLHWNIYTQYDKRLTETFKHLDNLNTDIERMQKIYNSFVRTRQAATQSYEGYDNQIRRLRNKTQNAMKQVKVLMARQGHMLEVMAVNELVKRREKLAQEQIKARFAMAESYDRATMEKSKPAPKPEGDKATSSQPEASQTPVEKPVQDEVSETQDKQAPQEEQSGQ